MILIASEDLVGMFDSKSFSLYLDITLDIPLASFAADTDK